MHISFCIVFRRETRRVSFRFLTCLRASSEMAVCSAVNPLESGALSSFLRINCCPFSRELRRLLNSNSFSLSIVIATLGSSEFPLNLGLRGLRMTSVLLIMSVIVPEYFLDNGLLRVVRSDLSAMLVFRCLYRA